MLVAEWQTLGSATLDTFLREMHRACSASSCCPTWASRCSACSWRDDVDRTIGLWAIVVFVAPLAFAWQMLQRTHSLELATEELAASRRENEYQALHDSLTGLPEPAALPAQLAEAIEDARPRRRPARA